MMLWVTRYEVKFETLRNILPKLKAEALVDALAHKLAVVETLSKHWAV